MVLVWLVLPPEPREWAAFDFREDAEVYANDKACFSLGHIQTPSIMAVPLHLRASGTDATLPV